MWKRQLRPRAATSATRIIKQWKATELDGVAVSQSACSPSLNTTISTSTVANLSSTNNPRCYCSLRKVFRPAHVQHEDACPYKPMLLPVSNSSSSSLTTLFSRSLPHPSQLSGTLARCLFGFSKPERVTLKERMLVSYPAALYFDVVMDINRYHEFVPFCSASRITRRISSREIEADLTIGFRIFTESYTSRVTFNRPNLIQIKSVKSSVFGHLISTWRFLPKGDDANQCYVEFDIDFEVSSPVHASAVKLFFSDVAERQIKAFRDRCAIMAKENQQQQQVKPVVTRKPQTSYPTRVASVPAPTPSIEVSKTGVAIASAPSSLPVGDVCMVSQLGARVKFNADEISKLQSIFVKHARTQEQIQESCRNRSHPCPNSSNQCTSQSQPISSPSTTPSQSSSSASYSEHLYNSAGAELRLDLQGFVQLCKDVCLATDGVFSKFRERATVRTIADIGASGVLSHALFVADSQFFAFYSQQVDDNGGEVEAVQPHPVHQQQQQAWINANHHRHDPDDVVISEIGNSSSNNSSLLPTSKLDVSNTSSLATKLHVEDDELPHSYSFGDFLSHFYYLTKASMEEKLLYYLMIASKRKELYGKETYELWQGFERVNDASTRFPHAPLPSNGVSPIPDIFTRRASAPAPSLSSDSLKVCTTAFFCQHLGVLRHIMPLMSYHRAREMRQQIDEEASISAANTDNSTPADPGVTVLALLGLLESVLSEAETAVTEVMEQIAEEAITARNSANATPTSATTPAALPSNAILLDEWVYRWTKQAELLALISVPGLATMIQFHSVIPSMKKK